MKTRPSSVTTVSPRPATSGIALIIVLIVVVVLGMLAAAFAYAMKVETTLARHTTHNSDLDRAGLNGVEVAKWVLGIETQESRGVDSLKLKSMGGPGDTNSILYGVDLKSYPIFGPLGDTFATLSIDIVDMDRRFNINTADKLILDEALTIIGVDAAEASTIVASILDWRDRGSDQTAAGAESQYYESQDPPYFAKDGPIDDLSEVLLVKGVTPALYYGAGAGGMMGVLNRRKSLRSSVFEEPTYPIGLVNLFTPISGGRVNIYTADSSVLQVFPGVLAEDADAWISFRNGQDGAPGTLDDIVMPVGGGGLMQIPGMRPEAMAALQTYGTSQSRCFEARINVDVRGTKREYVAILRRNGPKDVQTLNVYWK